MLINICELGKPKRNVITQSLIDEWVSERDLLSDLSESLTNKDDSENFMIASRELIKRIEEDVWVEQKRITRERDQLKLLKEAKANLLEQIAELQGEAL
ncbi:hypothetical protein ATI02_4735 [Pseudomonas baetica]|jgi:hypothetical protein|uniref:Uncharacterized protein n=1 Tax=Pseudomonas baetica TaxID=674054 RepID=A0ABX4Q4L8_9PSED|nr:MULTISPECIES: hypothetical protein [Pseudomonas]MBV4509531.1 hypothetical protein [Pseudomonas sp. SWRI22]MDA7013302.1 hypothetical protein [Pseudomonas cerasi]PKA71734.1 hypothetical protein ATI02_4735 [Pseudomonas baetica]PTC20209.1 hypothetical protein C0J26_09580 [Pseudomonas baetica]